MTADDDPLAELAELDARRAELDAKRDRLQEPLREEMRARLKADGERKDAAKAAFDAASTALSATILEAVRAPWFPIGEIPAAAGVAKSRVYQIKDEADGKPKLKRTSKAKDADQ